IAASCAAVADRPAGRIGDLGERRIAASADHLRVMKFVAADACAGFSERAIGSEHRLAVPQVQTALVEGCREAKQVCHRMAFPLRISDRSAQDHVASARAVHGPCLGETAQTVFKSEGSGYSACMKFRI